MIVTNSGRGYNAKIRFIEYYFIARTKKICTARNTKHCEINSCMTVVIQS